MKISRWLFRFIYKISCILAVFRNNEGRIKPLLNLSGFNSNRKYMYPNFKKEKKYYFKDFHRYYSYLINEGNQQLFVKLTAYLVFSKLINYSNVLGIISKGEYISYNGDYNIDNILEKDRVVIKPIYGGKGHNVFVSIKNDYDKFLVNSIEYSKDEFKKFLLSLNNYIIEDFVEQHNYIKTIYPNSTNTIRVVTMREPNKSEIFIAWGAQRIGTNKSAPVDNWSAGGISSEINIESGILSSAKFYDAETKILKTYDNHPNTEKPIKGIKVPNWKIIKESLLDTHKKLININFIAWDIVVTEDSFTVIEVNNTSGVEHIQVHRPLLKDAKVKKFFLHHKII